MPFQILSLSGGGFLGLYTISVIADLERNLGRPFATCFDLLAGTSVGGIIALGLAAETPAEKIRSAFETNGHLIFSDRPAPTTRLGRAQDFLRSLFSPKYTAENLRKTIEQVVGPNTTIADLRHPVLIPTVNLTKGRPQVFKTSHHPTFQFDHKLKVVDVALATSAAPTYFPVAEIGDQFFADGGLYANSPDLFALHEAEYFFNVRNEDIWLLSVGTSTTEFSFSHSTGRDLGVWQWGRRLAQTMISSQQLSVDFIAKHKLNDRYLRIDEVQSREQERDLDLDIATSSAQKTIRGIAYGSSQSISPNPVLRTILSRTAPPPKFYHLSPSS